MTIYLDILILTNLFVTYFLLQSTKAILHRRTSKKRMLLASLFGGMSATIILIPALHPIVLAGIKLMISLVICIIAFGKGQRQMLLKSMVGFYTINFIYAGLMLAVWYFVTPIGMQFRNGVAYFNLSSMVLLLSTLFAYIAIQLTTHILNKTPQQQQLFDIQVCCDGKSVLVRAFFDTGNQLTDIITGLPVAFCEINALKDLMPSEVFDAFANEQIDQLQNNMWRKRVRMLPVSSVMGEGLALGFKPEQLVIDFHTDSGIESLQKQAIVAVSSKPLSSGEFSMIIGSLMLQRK